jgi:hypothetical protein
VEGPGPAREGVGANVDALGVSGLINTVKVEKGTTFTYQVSIRNDGPIPVTIKDIGMRGGAITTRVVAVNSHPYENGGSSRGFMPFSAFRLDRIRKRSSRWKFR